MKILIKTGARGYINYDSINVILISDKDVMAYVDRKDQKDAQYVLYRGENYGNVEMWQELFEDALANCDPNIVNVIHIDQIAVDAYQSVEE